MEVKIEEIPNTAGNICGEGPIWSSRTQRLYWLDIERNTIYAFDPASLENISYRIDQTVGTIVLRRSGGAVVALHKGLAFFSFETGKYEIIEDPVKDDSIRFNDGKCDPQGRFWAGTMEFAEKNSRGKLFMLDCDRKVHTRLEGVTVSNGICWTADSKTMYYIDSPTRKIDAFDFDIPTGAISNRRTVATFGDGDGFPDGMTIDSEGNLWVGMWEGHKIVCADPRTGKIIRTVPMPVARVTAVAFGGSDLTDLYATSAARGGLPAPAGALFRITGLGAKGVESFEYLG